MSILFICKLFIEYFAATRERHKANENHSNRQRKLIGIEDCKSNQWATKTAKAKSFAEDSINKANSGGKTFV